MTTLTLELSTEVYEQLQAEANHDGASVQQFVRQLLTERLHPTTKPLSERERVTEALRQAGLLAELSPEEKRRAESCTVTLDEVRAALDQSSGPPLSELVLKMRGPKE